MKFEPAHIILTGASGGIGGALAAEYAGPGVMLSLAGRSERRLEQIAVVCRAKGADVSTEVINVCETETLRSWVKNRDAVRPVDLAIACAGVSASSTACNGIPTFPEHPADALRVFDVNTRGAVMFIDAALSCMLPRKRGQIAVIGSIAALYPLPSSPAYCASKAAIRTYALALRNLVAASGVRVNVISPGYVDTPMSRRLLGHQPFRCSAEMAARAIRQALRKNMPEYSFPRPLVYALLALRMLPWPIAKLFLGAFHFEVIPDQDSPLRESAK